MIALLVGVLFVAFAAYAVLPMDWALGWGPSVVAFLRGGVPILAVFVGLIAILIGIADLKDKAEAKKEEAQEAAEQKPE